MLVYPFTFHFNFANSLHIMFSCRKNSTHRERESRRDGFHNGVAVYAITMYASMPFIEYIVSGDILCLKIVYIPFVLHCL